MTLDLTFFFYPPPTLLTLGESFCARLEWKEPGKETREIDCIMQGCDFHGAQRDGKEMLQATLLKEIGQG